MALAASAFVATELAIGAFALRSPDVLDGIQKNLHRAATKIDEARKGTRTIQRKLSDVQELPSTDAAALLERVVIDVDQGEFLAG